MDEFAAVHAALDALATTPLDEVDDLSLGGSLVELFAIVARLDGEIARRLAVFDGRGAAATEGTASTAGWLQSVCLLGPGEARARLATARAMELTLSATKTALARGDVSLRHAEVIAEAVQALPTELVPDAERTLVAAAERSDPGALRRQAARLRHTVDPAVLAQDAAAARQQRRLDIVANRGRSYTIAGVGDAASMEVLLTAVHALSAPLPDDTRTPAQRRYDALIELARRELNRGELPDCGGERPHVTVTVDLPTLLGRPGAAPAELGWTGPAALPELLASCCDASVVRVVTAGASELLDVGRRTRIVPPALRRALEVRDRGCAFPRCDRPPPWCDAHHLVHWAHGGPTTLDNLALLCGQHHHAVHDRGWTLARRPDGEWHTHPPPVPEHVPRQRSVA